MTSTTPSGAPARLPGADAVRALAALWVVLYHLFQRLDLPAQVPWYQEVQLVVMKGSFGVSIFFVLSGMLLGLPYWRAYLAGAPRPRLGHYVRRRAARIVPGFYVSLVVSFAVGLVLFPDAPYAALRALAGLTFTSGLHWLTFFPVEANGPLWSVGFEVISYALLPLAMLALFRLRRRGAALGLLVWLGVILAVVAVNELVVRGLVPPETGRGWAYGQVGGAKEWWPSYNPIGFFAHFAVGVLAAGFVAVRGRRGPSWAFDALGATAIVGAVGLVWVFRAPPEPMFRENFQGQPYLFPAFAVLVAVALVGLAHSRALGRLLDTRFARYTATVSFGIYVWHYLVLTVVAHLCDGELEYFGVADPWRHAALSAAVLGVTYVLASASWFWLERPVLRSRWAAGPTRPTSPDAANSSEKSRHGRAATPSHPS